MESFSRLIVICIVVNTWCVSVRGDDGKCIEGLYHKEKPSPETAEYKFCTPWKNLTCCTHELDNEINMNDSPKKYNDSWHLCGNLSSDCLMFWKRQECFYQCSPYTYKWQHSTYKDGITGVPLCASDCDDWFDACKDDLICVENVLEDYNETKAFGKICPTGKNCTTYKNMYGGGKNLCEKLWGSSYKYTKQNAAKDNCMVMWFTPGSENPNKRVRKDVDSKAPVQNSLAVLFLLPAFQVFRFI